MKNFLDNDKYRLAIRIIIVLFAVVLAVYCVTRVTTTIFKGEKQQIEVQMKELTEQNAKYVEEYVTAIINSIEQTAMAISMEEDIVSPRALMFAEELKTLHNLENVLIVFENGNYVSSLNTVGLINSYRKTVNVFESGEMNISSVYVSQRSQKIFAINVPIKKGGEVVAVLSATYSVDVLAKIMDITCFEGKGYVHVFQRDGTFVIRSPRSGKDVSSFSFFGIQSQKFFDGYDFASLRNDVENEKSGYFRYEIENEERLCYFMPSTFSDWYVATLVPYDVIGIASASYNIALTLLIAVLAVIFTALFFVLFFDTYARKRDLTKVNNNLRRSESRFRLAATHAACIVFEYDFRKDEIKVLNSLKNEKGKDINVKFFDNTFGADYIHPLDEVSFMKLIEEMRAGSEFATRDLRMKLYEEDKIYSWYRYSISTVALNGKAEFAVGTIENINNQKLLEFELKEKAQKDSLTSLFNRAECVNFINFLLGEEDALNSVFMIFDMDNFKAINDSFGHLTGDIALKEVSSALMQVFNKDAIIGRLGGDEFMVFDYSFDARKTIEEKLETLMNILQNENINKKVGERLTLSVGFTKPDENDTFLSIYRKADKALYEAKNSGRNKFIENNE